jgi:hypothetical protein
MMFLKIYYISPDGWVSEVAGQSSFNTELNMIFLFTVIGQTDTGAHPLSTGTSYHGGEADISN